MSEVPAAVGAMKKLDYSTDMYCEACENGQPHVSMTEIRDSVFLHISRLWCLRHDNSIHLKTKRLAAFVADGVMDVVGTLATDACVKIIQYELVLDTDEFYDGLRSLLMLQQNQNAIEDNGHIAFVDAAVKRALGVLT